MPTGRAFATKIDEVSSTIALVGGKNATVGDIREEHNGKKYILVKAAGNLANGYLCTFSAADYTVNVSGANVTINGVNSTGGQVDTGEYFWMQVYGEADVGSAGISGGDAVCSTGSGVGVPADTMGQGIVGYAKSDTADGLTTVFISPQCFGGTAA